MKTAPETFRVYRKKFVLENTGEPNVGIWPYYNEAEVTIRFRYPEQLDNGSTEPVKKQLTDVIQKGLEEVLADF